METLKKFIFILVVSLSLLRVMPSQVCLEKGRMIKLHFYVHDVFSGNNPTNYRLARANGTDSLTSRFVLMDVVDDKVTYEPGIDSEELGRMQGIATYSDLKQRSVQLLLSLSFTSGKCKGSTLNILGRNPLQEKERAVTINGGTHAFRMACGYAITSTYAVEDDGARDILEYTAYVCMASKACTCSIH